MTPQPPNVEPTARVVYEAAIAAGIVIPEGRNWHLSDEEIAKRYPHLRRALREREP